MPEISEDTYFRIRNDLQDNHSQIIKYEERYMRFLVDAIRSVGTQIADDIGKASELMPFWINYPPLQRGRAPTGQSIPWLEVGETVISAYTIRALVEILSTIRHPGLPSGADIRFVTDDVLIHLDIKITGPNDRADEIVASPNQISGDGKWWDNGVINSAVSIQGKRAAMLFQPELSPFYLLQKRTLVCLTYFLKGVYVVGSPGQQPLDYLELVCVPNGLLAFTGPNYNQSIPGLFIPGKDEKTHKKKRVRVRMSPLASINEWRREIVWTRDHNPNES